MLRILGKASSINVRKVLWTCDEIGLAYSREDWGTGFRSTRTPGFLAMNPNGLVPVVEDEEGVLWEANTICRYLAAKHGSTDLLPAEPRRRARVGRRMDRRATDLDAPRRHASLALVRRDPACADPAQVGASVRGWNAAMGVPEGRPSATGAYAAGEASTPADVVPGLSVNRWLETPMRRPVSPAVVA